MPASPADAPLPDVVDDPAGLTPEWLTAALRHRGHDASVAGVDVTPVGTGQMGSSFRLTISYDGAPEATAPRSLVAKLPTPDLEARVSIAASHRTEVTFYRDLAGTVAARTPACHLALISEDATRFTLLLEDLTPARQGDQLAGCGPDELVAAAHNLAGLHGPRWGDPTLVDHRGPLDAADADTAVFLADVYAGAIAPFADQVGDRLEPADIALLERCADSIPALLLGRDGRSSLLHGDYRLDNLMFHPDGTVAAVDWQTVGVGLPARDLAYLIATSMDPDDRRSAEPSAIDAYHRRLTELAGERSPERDTVEDDYRLGLLQGPLIIVLGAAFGSTTERGNTMFATMARRVCAALRDHDTLATTETR